MYARILLAYDGSPEGRAALREGALLAKHCGAQVFLLSVVAENPGMRMAEGVQAGPMGQQHQVYQEVLEGGLTRLRELGMDAVAELMVGEPAQAIGAYATRIKADLVVVAHRKQTLFERWWSGSVGAFLSDHVSCSLLLARNTISDEAFEAVMGKKM
jgi:nucleotide-binding universal stress UspA family protein